MEEDEKGEMRVGQRMRRRKEGKKGVNNRRTDTEREKKNRNP